MIVCVRAPHVNTPLLKKLNRARNDLSGKVIPLFKTYQDWEKKIIFEPFDRENLAGQPTILVRLKWPFFTPICQKAWQANYFIRKFWHGWSYFLHSPRLSFLIPLYSIIYRGIIVSNSRSLNWPSFNVIIKWKTTGLFFVWKLCKSRNPIALVSCNKSKFGAFYVYFQPVSPARTAWF